ncbi:MAG: hypothetical protein NTY19_20050 [Planctomycetota bacterium]|nr:hypothetical protein [Planctomycetota bacterium]
MQRRWSALEPLTGLGCAPQEIDYTNRVAELRGEGKDFSDATTLLPSVVAGWRPSAEEAAMPQATLPTAQPSEPAVPESNGDNGSHRGDPSEVNVDDWEVASPDL